MAVWQLCPLKYAYVLTVTDVGVSLFVLEDSDNYLLFIHLFVSHFHKQG